MNNWFAAAAAGVLALFGASTTGDHKMPPRDLQGQPSTTRPVKGTVDIQCVAAAVAIREASLQTAESTYTSGIDAAYATREEALANAYTLTGNDGIKAAVHVAWKNFSSSVQGAKKAWQKSKDNAWSIFRTSLKDCGNGAESLADSSNASAEMSGQ